MFSFHLWFGLCLAAYLLHTLIHTYDLREERGELVGRFGAFLLLFTWVPWLGMLLSMQPAIADMGRNSLLFFVGIFQAVAGVCLIGFGLKEKPGFEQRMEVVAEGIYSKFLHPVYYGMILLILGLPILRSAQYALYTSPLWVAFIVYYMVTETRFLEAHAGKKFRKLEEEVLI